MTEGSKDLTNEVFSLAKPPIIEAVVDIDCDMPPGFNLKALEKELSGKFRPSYPSYRPIVVMEHRLNLDAKGSASSSGNIGLQSLRFGSADGRQMVQTRLDGYSFNRLPPYTGFDDYLPEIERTWHIFAEATKPIEIKRLAVRFINRVSLPAANERVNLDEYLTIGPKLPMENELLLVSFVNQQQAQDRTTGNLLSMMFATEPMTPHELPVIVDITAIYPKPIKVGDWSMVHEQIMTLRRLKNRVFRNTLTEKCLKLFQ